MSKTKQIMTVTKIISGQDNSTYSRSYNIKLSKFWALV